MSDSPNPVLICIAGGSASGKSTVSRALVESLPDLSVGVVNIDHYFRDWSVDEDLRTANRPDAVLWPSLLRDVDRLLARESVELPALGTRPAAQGAQPWIVEARDVLIVEGLLALWHDGLRARADLAVYVDAPDDERLLRRIRRDIVERGATVDSATTWYRHDVRPNFGRFTEPTRWQADLVIPNVGIDGVRNVAIVALAATARALHARSQPRP